MAFLDPDGKAQTSLSEINVTPLVDVMLVLLVIFMVTAPILQTGIQVELPRTRTAEPDLAPAKAIIITVDRRSNLYLSVGRMVSSAPINVSDFPKLLEEKLAETGERKVYVRGDGDAPWRTIAYVLGLCRQAGATVRVVTELAEERE